MAGEHKADLVPVHTMSNPGESTNINAIPFGFQLSDSNFKVWSKMMEVHASGLGKLRYLIGKIPAIEKDAPGYARWSTEDAIVRGWLLKTMESHLLGLFIDLPTTRIFGKASRKCSMMVLMSHNIMNSDARLHGQDKMVSQLTYTSPN
ncbi:hypothetical protein COP2_008434 [Malus domestica]